MALNQGIITASALAAVLLLIGAAAQAGRWLFHERFPGRLGFGRMAVAHAGASPPRLALQIRSTLALDAKRRLHLVVADGACALVLTGGDQDVLIPWPPRSPDLPA